MFTIKNGFAYLIKEGKGYKIDFDENEKMISLKNDKDYILDSVENLEKYSYYEIFRKLNVRYNSELKRENLLQEEEHEAEIKSENKKQTKKTSKK